MKNVFLILNVLIGLGALVLGVVAFLNIERDIGFLANGSLALVTAAGCLWMAMQLASRRELS
jgi:hypothetical protein